jgi:hypothetical protein
MHPLLYVFILVAIGFALVRIAKHYKSYSELIGYVYRKKFALNRFEKAYLNNHTKIIKRNFVADVCIEIFIGLYTGVVRELSYKQQKDKKLNGRLMDFCIAVVKKKYNLILPFDFSSYKELLPEEVYVLLKDKELSMRELTEPEEQQLFNRDTKRWKRVYDSLVSNFDKERPEVFYKDICKLGSYHENIGVIRTRSLYYNAYNFMIDYDRKYALKLYLHYLNMKSKSETFRFKEITKRNASVLFDTDEQKRKFAAICSQLQDNQDIAMACGQVDELFVFVRRKINLHVESIKDAKARHNEVAQILGHYLDEDVPVEEKLPVATTIEPAPDNKKELFDLFISQSFRLNRQEVNIFASSKGLFRDHFIESINEAYYETLDDLLIEEEDDCYIMNEAYYQQIK